MGTLFGIFTQICLPVFVLIGAGWTMDRIFRMDLRSFVKLNLQLFVPAFLFVQLIESPMAGGTGLRVFLFTASMILILAATAGLIARLLRWPDAEARALRIGVMFQNAGNFGIPVMVLAYPGRGPAIEVFVIAAVNICTFTIGVLFASGGRNGVAGWRRFLPVLRQMSVWAIVLALLCKGAGIPVTTWTPLWIPLEYLKEGLVPVALVTLGIQLSKTGAGAVIPSQIGVALALRLVAAPLLAVPVTRVFGFAGEDAAILILSAAFPSAVNAALIAHEFGAAHRLTASVVFFSTLAGALTVTVTLAILRTFPPG